MALWHQIRRSGIQRLVLSCQNPNFLYATTRSFAVPAHVKAKQTAESSGGPRINDAITSAYVRLVTDQGHGVVSRLEALDRAKKLNLDLVEVQRTAKPPVCKLMDFHKEKFKQEVKEKDRAKSKSTATLRNGENKEVRFTAKTELKDLKIKAETITRLMERGYRVKCTVLPSGKEGEDLRGLLSRILALIEDVAILETGPHVVETKQAYIIVRHAKFTTKKSGKKAIKALDAVNRVQSAVLNESEAVKNNIQEEMPDQSEEWEYIECSSDTESEILSDQVKHNIQKSVFKATNDHKLDPLQQKPSHSKPALDSLRPKRELNKEQTNLKSPSAFVSSQSEPSVVEVNRYAKQSEPKRFHQNRERMPHQATRNESEIRVQFDPKQRQFNSSNPSSPSSGGGRFSSTEPAVSVDQSKLGTPIMGKLNDPNKPLQSSSAAFHQRLGGTTIIKPSNPSSSTPSYGKFSTSDQRNSEVSIGDKPRNPSPRPSYGNFSASKTVPSSDQRNSGEAIVDQTRNSSSPTRSYGIFSSTKPVGSGDQSSINNTTSGKPSSSTQSYGIFSATKPVGSGEQRSFKDATSEKPFSTSSAPQSCGIFSKSKAGSPGA